MSMNLANNIQSLGYKCDCLTHKNWKQVTKTRYMHLESNHMFIRIDSNQEKIKRINLSEFYKIEKDYDLIAISDYDKGFLTEYDIEVICSRHPNVFIDTKKKIGDYISNAKFIKINTPEYKISEDYINSTPSISSKIIRTSGGDGAYYQGKNFPTKKVEVRDVSGAGDSFFAGLVCQYLNSKNIEKAIKFANKCASKVVQQKGVTTIN
jgi:bifunctional ADP-heptose synthase (sugar kinase/adenylyltransferase)